MVVVGSNATLWIVVSTKFKWTKMRHWKPQENVHSTHTSTTLSYLFLCQEWGSKHTKKVLKKLLSAEISRQCNLLLVQVDLDSLSGQLLATVDIAHPDMQGAPGYVRSTLCSWVTLGLDHNAQLQTLFVTQDPSIISMFRSNQSPIQRD